MEASRFYGVLFSVFVLGASTYALTDEEATQFTSDYTDAAEVQYNQSVTVSWTYNTNLTTYNSEQVNQQALSDANFTYIWGVEAKTYQTDGVGISETNMRQIDSISILGTANLDDAKQQEYNQIMTDMETSYSTACVDIDGECKPLDPDLTAIMATSRDYYELKQAWKGWYEASGREIRNDYEKFVPLSNEASQGDGYSDTGEYWRSWYEMEGFEEDLERLWNELQPMYQQLHAYVRRQLFNHYGADFVDLKGPIPAHLFGNMWAQQWGNIYSMMEPYPGKQSVDATPAMQEQGWTVMQMFETSEDFFISLGLLEMTDEFWEKSMLEKPTDGRDVVCHASAWDFYTRTDFRIKQCTVVNMEDLITVHHEMGHIQYFQQYKDQPVPFRNGANPGFHEAVGDTLSLSVSTPAHLEAIGLLDEVSDDYEADINYLFSQALDKIAFLPFGYLIDKWRWAVFDGTVTKDKYQEEWDRLRLNYQGIVPPVQRDGTIDFDPGAKYHIPANTPYIRYFVSFVIQFQFYKAMCDEAGHEGPLYKCDFYNSKDAGAKLEEMLKLGSSEPWPDAMEKLTGGREMSTVPLQEYFAPLTEWLAEQNGLNGDTVGWEEKIDWRPKGFLPASEVQTFIDNNNSTGEVEYYNAVLAEWNYNTDITDENQAKANEANQQATEWAAAEGRTAMQYDPVEIEDPTNQRLITLLSDEGTGALSEDKLAELTKINSDMATAYSTATVTIDGQEMSLDPDLYAIMATSRNYNDLREAWDLWREAVGTAEQRSNYERYVELNNEAAVLNNYPDNGAYWRSVYETEDYDKLLEEVWQDVLPLYEELHAFVRRRLYNVYGHEVINLNGPIPAHLLGNMWAQDWSNIYDIVEPFAGKVRPDATEGLIQQGWTVMQMFETADKFFSDMGLVPCPQEFWDHTMFEKPTDGREVVCHASAWDFYNRKDFRVKMCTRINEEDFITIHHELGHIQYYLQYDIQHTVFRNGANPGFHEAVGDTLALSVGTLDHMYKLGLIDKPDEDYETDINYLMSMALQKIAFLPFGYLTDKWRWDVFDESASPKNWNQQWWNYRIRLQGVTPPNIRDEKLFDPSAKFHISNDVPYIRYFVSSILQFQFYEALCNEAGHIGPLYKCDFNGSHAAGKLLGDMLQLGNSVTWEEALTQITGSPVMTSKPMVKYFQELLDYLKEENIKNGDTVGWNDYSWQPPTDTTVEADGKVTVGGSAFAKSPSMLFVIIATILGRYLQ